MEGGLQPTLLEAGGDLRSAWRRVPARRLGRRGIGPPVDRHRGRRPRRPRVPVRPARRGHLLDRPGGRRPQRPTGVLAPGAHEKGRIFHGLYEGSSTSLGAIRPLADHPETAPLAAMVDEEGGLDTGAPDNLTAAYVPNVRPARAWRHIPTAAYWGQSDFQGRARAASSSPPRCWNPSAPARARRGARSAGSTRGSACSSGLAIPTRSRWCSSRFVCRSTATPVRLWSSKPCGRPATRPARSASPTAGHCD